MSSFGKGLINHAAETRLRVADHFCPAKGQTGEHNNMPTVRHWFRRYDVCASCGYVARVR